jgi:Predicted ornithine cyclodeaminase, mu-crystallin homolog
MITYVTEEDVKSNLKMGECIEELRNAFKSYGNGVSDAHPRDRIIKIIAYLILCRAFMEIGI